MTILGTIQNIQSNIIGYESLAEYGFCRTFADADLDTSNDDVELGTVVYDAGDGGWNAVDVALVEAGTAETLGVVIGFGTAGEAIVANSSATDSGMLLTQGQAILRKGYLRVSEGNPTTDGLSITADDLAEYVEANTVLINVDDSAAPFDGTYGDEG